MRAKRPVLKLSEWKLGYLENTALSRADRELAEQLGGDNGRVDVDEMRTGVRVQARSWVGVVHFESFELRIVPKLPGDSLNLVDMLTYASGLDALRRNRGTRTLEATPGDNLFDLAAYLLAEACDRLAIQGLLHDYVEHESDLPVLRGRLLAEGLDLTALKDGILYNRLNEHYRDAHRLTAMILGGLGIDDLLSAGTARGFAFLLDMNLLFEQFIFRFVENLLPRDRYRVHYQHRDPSIIWDTDRRRPYTPVIPDLLIEPLADVRRRLVIDSKYKAYDERRVSTSDIYQTFLYAFAYNHEPDAIPAALLLYPATQAATVPLRLHVRTYEGPPRAHILVLGLYNPQALKEIDSPGPLMALLAESIERCLFPKRLDQRHTAST